MEKPHYHGHRQRLKEKFLRHPESLADYELLELLLFFTYPRRDTKPVAKEILENSSLEEVAQAKAAELSPSTALLFKTFQELQRRLLQQAAKTAKTSLNSYDKVAAYLQFLLGPLSTEAFYILYLDTKMQLIAEEKAQAGTVDEVAIYPREVIKQALLKDAKYIILAHNHPSGDPTPSSADIELTKQIHSMGQAFNVQVLDHIIIGGPHSFSLKGAGYI